MSFQFIYIVKPIRALILINLFFTQLICYHAILNAQTASPQETQKQLLALVDKIEKELNQSHYHTEVEDYFNARSSIESALENIDFLLKLFMPLAERLKTILSEEKSIKNETQNLIDQFIPFKKAEVDKKRAHLISRQLSNRNTTLEIDQLISNQLGLLSNTPSQQANTPNPQKSLEKTQNKLQQIQQLMKDAITLENHVINWLEASNLGKAVYDERNAVQKMEEALELLQQEKQSKKNQQNNQQNSSQSDGAQKQSASEQKKDSGKSKKMSVEEALKELARINKETKDEKKKREEKYGVIQQPGQIPVEKDW